mgnify:CR=1 FL=1
MNAKKILINSFKAGLEAVKPENIIKNKLPSPPKGRTYVIGAGKAAASMAKAIELNWPRNLPLNGSVITRYKHSLKTKKTVFILTLDAFIPSDTVIHIFYSKRAGEV